jgi:AraC-like DNA-binding protein
MLGAFWDNLNLQSTLDSIGFLQGIILGIILLILNAKNSRSCFFLGLFLFAFSLKLAYFIPGSLDLEKSNPYLFLLPFNFSWLLFPLFYIYTQQVSFFSDQKTRYWILLPGVLSFLAQLYVYLLPYDEKLEIATSGWFLFVFTYLGIFYAWAIGLWNLWLLRQHRVEVQNVFSFVESKEMQWANYFLIYSLVTSVIIHILYFIAPQNYYFKIIFSVFDLFAIYWIFYHGIRQRNVLSYLSDSAAYVSPQKVDMMEKTTPPAFLDELKVLGEEIDRFMMSTESFVNAELTIIELSDKLKEHPKRISMAINTVFNQNFNSYVNDLRVKKAISLLKNNGMDHLSIEGLGREVGFHSKSAFYAAFRKTTGTTPANFGIKVKV